MMHEVLETPDGIKLKQTRTMKELWYVRIVFITSIIYCSIFEIFTIPSLLFEFFSDIWDLGGYLKECEEKRQLTAESLKKVRTDHCKFNGAIQKNSNFEQYFYDFSRHQDYSRMPEKTSILNHGAISACSFL